MKQPRALLLVTALLGFASVRCAAEGGTLPDPEPDAGGYAGSGGTSDGSGGAGGATPSSGGTAPSSGGTPGGTGGWSSGGADPGTGGASSGGADPGTGGASAGGASSGGADPGTGGASAGGASAGGADPGTGGASAGGASAGGASSGGASSGGASAGGASAGGASSGGASAGGASAGGASAGGASSGGASSGGASSGGASSGGASAGGASAGGASAGGASSGGASSGGASAGGAGAGGDGSGGAGAGGASPCGTGSGGVDPVGNDNRSPCFVDLSPPLGAPLPATGTALPAPPIPSGWQWHPIDGAICRNGSATGIFVRRGTAKQLLFYLEGGGACSNVGFCRFNPKSANEVLAGDGSTVLGTAGGAIAGRQQPGAYSGGTPAGIFDTANANNPFRDWSMVYVPYCTGDVHFGTRANATVPGTPGADPRDLQQHQFMGYRNMEKIVARVVPTFPDMTRVVLTGASAGAFGAELNFSMVQDAFVDTPVTVIGDSGIPFDDQFMPACMQKNWRDNWGLAFPPDCTECQQANGGGLLKMADFLLRKHPNAKIGIVSTMEDEVIRLFFSVGLQNCVNYATADPVAITLFQGDPNVYMVASTYSGGMSGVRTLYQSTNRLATYYMPGPVPHQHIFRPSFYTTTVGGVTMLKFVNDFLGGTVTQIGP